MQQVLAEPPICDLPTALRKRLLEVAILAPAARPRELQRAFSEAVRE